MTKRDNIFLISTARVARFFKKKRQTFSKKGQKRPTKLLKKAKHSVTIGQKRAKPFT